ncbi:MAG: hypothetical protein F6K23_38260 [Okeania sp. SIO2C9]|uniref:hypothetical protein n=1 Tax=Okeania sp. SIO2C9 TaxID=2607791 RepID=UPI0013C1337B|nr:hypothetical protein [Okeania sp. SIO2C9]NEQ78320.1 hypothetical protein [Okeania sp. SIO2C9]
MGKKVINRDVYYTRKQLKELGMSSDEVLKWIGDYDAKDKCTFLYLKKRCDDILASDNWKAWTTGEGYVYFTSKKGNEAALIMKAPKSYEATAYKKNGKWYPRVRHRSFPGAKGCSTLDECRKIVEDRPYKTYDEWKLWNSGYSKLGIKYAQILDQIEENQMNEVVGDESEHVISTKKTTRMRHYNEPAWYSDD